MTQFILGALIMGGFLLLVDFTRNRRLEIPWWGWLLTILGFAYGIFVLEVIIGFMGEGAPQAALVMGLILGLIAVIWGVLLARFVFGKAATSKA